MQSQVDSSSNQDVRLRLELSVSLHQLANGTLLDVSHLRALHVRLACLSRCAADGAGAVGWYPDLATVGSAGWTAYTGGPAPCAAELWLSALCVEGWSLLFVGRAIFAQR